ncbi:hypothetical protein COLO4_05982 [Corchorus olitorius]|uniref:Uncharacterized protein n=1 Tax=Corchorus olitorius TaxID=93759 RepID=A0A1R3KPG5_9ROSI|nr:hypothetical protein COLO4_05982 [Corchorus olitorius]
MKVVVKYFEKGGGEGWRAAVEAEREAMVAADDDNDVAADKDNDDRRKENVEESGVLDLNAAPDEEEEEDSIS